jgi:hypothetical protein
MKTYTIKKTHAWSGNLITSYTIEVKSKNELFEYLGDMHGGNAPDEEPVNVEYEEVIVEYKELITNL